jgi:hypothetical protein
MKASMMTYTTGLVCQSPKRLILRSHKSKLFADLWENLSDGTTPISLPPSLSRGQTDGAFWEAERRTRGDAKPNPNHNLKNSRRVGRLQIPAPFGLLHHGWSNAALSVPPLSSAGGIPTTKARQPYRRHFSQSLDSLTALSVAFAAAEDPKLAQAQAQAQAQA